MLGSRPCCKRDKCHEGRKYIRTRNLTPPAGDQGQGLSIIEEERRSRLSPQSTEKMNVAAF